MSSKITVPVNVCIKRYYRIYVDVPVDSENEDVYAAVKNMIIEQGDDALTPDPDLEIEESDILGSDVDWDGVQFGDDEADENSQAPKVWHPESLYHQKGYKNRRDYLEYLSDTYEIPIENVIMLADSLGQCEDFDGLVTALEDFSEER